MSASAPSQPRRARRTTAVASLGYSLLYGLGFGLSAWGYDAWALGRSHADLAWAKLAAGLPLVLLTCALTGILAGRSDRTGVQVAVWLAGGTLIGVALGAMPYGGRTLVAWLAEPAMAGMNVYPWPPAATERAAFVALIAGSVGAPAGLVGHLAVERARGSTTDGRNTRWRRWAGLLLGLPLAALSGFAGDELINRPARVGQQTVHRAISTAPGDALGRSDEEDVAIYRDRFSAGYVLYLVDWRAESAPETEARAERGTADAGLRATVDVAFDTGLGMRCRASGGRLDGCLPISARFESWMAGLIEQGRSGGQGTELDTQPGQVSVRQGTLRWLAQQREAIGGPYEIFKEAQRGAWVIVSARFDTGYVLTCTFYGDSPVVLERCSASEGPKP